MTKSGDAASRGERSGNSRQPCPPTASVPRYAHPSRHQLSYAALSLSLSQGLSIYRPIIYGNTAHVLTPEEREAHPSREHTHRWTVALRSAASAEDSDIVGGADDLGYFIRRVTFKLHETYPNPSRSE